MMNIETASKYVENNETIQDLAYGLAVRQHGVLTRTQLTAVTSRSKARHALDRRRWIAIDGDVLRAAGAPWNDRSRTMAAVLAAGSGAMVSHISAASMWDVKPYRLDPLHLTVFRGHNPVATCLATVHRHRSLAEVPECTVDGIPVVRPEVAILQLCGMVHPERASRALDAFWRERLLSGPSIEAMLDRIGTRGLRGVRVLRSLLADRPEGYVPPASGLEGRVAQILRSASLPEMARQRDLGDEVHWCGRVDFSDEQLGIILEVDSEKFHSALLDVQHDLERQRALEEAGFIVDRVTDQDVWHRPQVVVATVKRLRRKGANRS